MKELLTSIEDNRRKLLSFRTVKEAHTTYTIRTFRANEARALKKKQQLRAFEKYCQKARFVLQSISLMKIFTPEIISRSV